MRWDNTAWQLLQYIEFIREKREIVTGRGMEFTREQPSIYEKRNANDNLLRRARNMFL